MKNLAVRSIILFSHEYYKQKGPDAFNELKLLEDDKVLAAVIKATKMTGFYKVTNISEDTVEVWIKGTQRISEDDWDDYDDYLDIDVKSGAVT